jgi:phospholipid/cholesterol/gamma-HCH transport system permease protein
VIGTIRSLGRWSLNLFERLGCGSIFLLRVLVGLGSLVTRPRLVVRELYSVGVLSLLIILVSVQIWRRKFLGRGRSLIAST